MSCAGRSSAWTSSFCQRPWRARAGGDYRIYTITSNTLGEDRHVAVYLPEGYISVGGDGFSVIYYFAGDG